MPKFYVEIQEVHYSLREVEANSADEAIELAGEADEIQLEYSHIIDGCRVRELPNGEWETR